jgi:dTDP-glucose pyrophosphorylase
MKDAIILAATKGTRMRPLSKYIPKCLLPLGDKTLIVYQLSLLESCGIHDVYITLEPVLGPLVERSLLQGYEGPLHLHFYYQKELAGIGYAVMLFKEKIQNDFIVILGDEYLTSNAFIEEAPSKKGDVVLGIVEYKEEGRICEGCNMLIDEEAGTILRLKEKPTPEQIMSPWCWTGFAKFSPTLFSILEEMWAAHDQTKELDLTSPVEKAIEKRLNVSYIKEPGININITAPEDYYRVLKAEGVI